MDHAFQKQIVEALIFASDVPISAKKIADLEEELDSRKIKKIVEELNSDYQKSKRAFFIANVAGGFQLNTRKDFTPWLKKLFKGRLRTRLSQASLESLAIITFKQPLSRVEVDAIRGVNSGGVIKNLLERNLVCIAGRSEGPGKPLLYGTTKEFLRYFGINDIADLPKPKEIDEIMGKLDQEEGISESIIETLTETESFEDESNHKDDSAQ
ncbi:SMC-Scp complex subunit ScpB [candidate division KSB1 bacterium]|nr:SMC-Scp complex subunit ScpB [candidate division KSB1 bacterium]TDI96447.1 MAG: SMC-Scp complex subunit ScpB [Caldithrix sp.]